MEVANPIAEAIQLSVAPVFLLTGVAGMLNALSTRLARVIDRGRDLEDRLMHTTPESEPRYEQFTRELRDLDLRRRVINGATALMVLCAVMIGLTVVELFYSTGLQSRQQLSVWVPTTFIAAFICFIAACVLYLTEILIASQRVGFFKNKR